MLFIVLVILFACSKNPKPHETLYGTFENEEPVITELLQHPTMLRLKNVQQYGTTVYAKTTDEYSRYDHSVGVFALLRRYNAPLEEQIAGLLHDTSHTVFSHVGDYLFDMVNTEESYQDKIHLWHLKKTGVDKVLERHGFTLEQASPDNIEYKALECNLPEMCADRIEYNLQGGLIKGLINKDEFNEILQHLKLENNTWFFTSPEIAKKFASIPLYMTQYQWGSACNLAIHQITAELLKVAIDKKIVTLEEIHFSTDDVIWNRMVNTDDPEIQNFIDKIMNYDKYFKPSENDDYDIILYGKFRGIDPLVKTENGYKKLTEIDPSFKETYENVKDIMTQGWPLCRTAQNTNDIVRENTHRDAAQMAINP